MNTGRTVFSQLMDYLSTYEFEKCVNRYSGDYRSRSLSCRDQFLAMAFAQLTYRESLRDIETCLRSIGSKLYHMGFRSTIARSTLADANESRDWRTCDRDQSLRIVRKEDRKSTRLNSSHANISYAVFCLKKKIKKHER